jgi:hypothetical protein
MVEICSSPILEMTCIRSSSPSIDQIVKLPDDQNLQVNKDNPYLETHSQGLDITSNKNKD